MFKKYVKMRRYWKFSETWVALDGTKNNIYVVQIMQPVIKYLRNLECINALLFFHITINILPQKF